MASTGTIPVHAPPAIGRSFPRVDGKLKVTGTAPYTAEHHVAGLSHGVFVGSAIASGRIVSIDPTVALKQPGVLGIFSHENAPQLSPLPDQVSGIVYAGEGGLIEMLIPMQDDRIHYAGQLLALVIAETFEQARYAASLVRIEYEESQPELRFETASRRSMPENYCGIQPLQVTTGDPNKAFSTAAVRLELDYETPVNTHNAIELASTIAKWETRGVDDFLTLYDTTRVLKTLATVLSKCLDLPPTNMRIISKYIGGAFGSKAWFFGNTLTVASCAKILGRPVKVEWSRQQMYAVGGHRPATRQTLKIGASRSGVIGSMEHIARSHTSMVSGFPEACTGMTSMMYAIKNLAISHDLRHLNLPTPVPMRGPGELVGGWALECAMDELAHELGMDPIDLRLKNYADTSPSSGLPFSSKHLRECYGRGRTLFEWDRRNPKPRSLRRGNELIGYGFASNCDPGMQSPASARATIFADGTAEIRSATHELGNGAWTIFRQIAADGLSMPMERVRFELGDSTFPDAPITAGSQTTASVGPAALAAGRNAVAALKDIARRDSASPLFGVSADGIVAEGCALHARDDPSRGEEYGAIIRRSGLEHVIAGGEAAPGDERKQFEFISFGAVFAEVRVDVGTGVIRVARLTGVFDYGRMINPTTARSQMMGGMIMALGATLMEESLFDPNNGRPVVRNLADYHVPSCADAPDILIDILDIPDPHIGELGARGVGEAGVNGAPAAITNAVFNATGKRLRSLPLTPDKVM